MARGQQVILAGALFEGRQRWQLGAAGIEVTPERRQHPYPPAAHQCIQSAHEPQAVLAGDPLRGEDLLELIHEESKPDMRLALQALVPGQLRCRLRQSALDQGRSCLGILPEHARQLAGARPIGSQLRERSLPHEARGEAGEQIRPGIRGAQEGGAPECHPLDDARLCQDRQNTGAGKGRLAAAAHAENQNERPPVGLLPSQGVQHLAGCRCPAEEHRSVLPLEDLQATERRARRPLHALGPLRAGRGHLADAGLHQLAQVGLEQLLVFRQFLERVEGRGERAIISPEPPVQEGVERLCLTQPIQQLGLGVQRRHRPGGLPVDQKIG